MREVELTQGKIALVDDKDYAIVCKYKWAAIKGTSGIWYAQAVIVHNGRKTVTSMHRMIMGLWPGDGEIVDHISRDGLDNRQFNLRIATNKENAQNQKPHKDVKWSKYKGVTYQKAAKRKKRWIARIIVNYKQIYVGFYKTEVEAAQAYDKAARQYFGEYARTNFAA